MEQLLTRLDDRKKRRSSLALTYENISAAKEMILGVLNETLSDESPTRVYPLPVKSKSFNLKRT